jgi:diguanylate cyclase (GGDEF)-like protein
MSCGAIAAIYAVPLLGGRLPDNPIEDMALLYLLCDLGLYLVIIIFVLLFELTKTQGFIKLEQALNFINELAIRDELTGSHNRRHLIKLIEHEKDRATRLDAPFCLCLLDIDFFKRINDTYGHSAGDTVLREFALAVQRQVRERDSFGRYGGEEFLLLLPETLLEEAVLLAERVRQHIETLGFPDIAPDFALSVSIGVAEFRSGESIGQTVARADEALYQAKSSGRNRVISYGQSPERQQQHAAPMVADLYDSAQCDQLTGLLNRRVLRDRLGHAMARAIRNERMLGLMLLNLNKFKEINEALGFDAGDAVLVKTANNVRECLRESDTIVRWGGDEFVVILEDLSNPGDAQQVAEKILDRFAMPLTVDDISCFVSLSIGISTFPAPACDIDALLKRADIAMTRAKSWGENTAQVYSSEANLPPSERLTLKNNLREALGANQLLLEYQPQVKLATGMIVGVEALIRWDHPRYGRIEPARFIALAEETGLIVPIGEWVLRTACVQHQAWLAAGLAPTRIAVNLSARQLKHPHLVERVLAILGETGIDARCLDLEISEGTVSDNFAHYQPRLDLLREAGIRISINGFGTGYSGMAYLTELSADILKLGRSFVTRLGRGADSERAYVLAGSVIDMAHRLRLEVVAEGVETSEQLADLGALGCDVAQGYYFNRPISADRIAALLSQQLSDEPEASLPVA